MINVPIDKIVPLTTARDTLSKIVAEVETNTPMYVLTKGGKPSVAVVNIDYLEKALNGHLVTETADNSPTNQDVSPEPTTETLSTTLGQPSIEKVVEPTATPSTESLPEPPSVVEPSQPSTETSAPSMPLVSDAPTVNDQSPPVPSSKPADQPAQTPSPTTLESDQSPSAPSTFSNPSNQSKPNIALGSMDGIQPQPFVPPPPETKPVDPNYTPNPAQYAGPTDPQTGTGDPKTSDLPDMVID